MPSGKSVFEKSNEQYILQALGLFRRQTSIINARPWLSHLSPVFTLSSIFNLASTFRCLYSYVPFAVTTVPCSILSSRNVSLGAFIGLFEAVGGCQVIIMKISWPVEELCSSCARFAKALHSSSSTSAPHSVKNCSGKPEMLTGTSGNPKKNRDLKNIQIRRLLY